MNGPAIEARALSKQFGDFVAVEGVSFAVAQGEVFGLLGPNGAGKSTAIRMLCGILAPSGGEARVAGHDISREPEVVRARIGYMSQRFSLYLDLTVSENLDFYGGVYGLSPERVRQRKAWAFEMAGLEEHRDRLTGELSAGWRQRLALGCALLHQPQVIFLDEPTAGADPISRRRFWEIIYHLASDGVTALVSTHYMDEAERCDRVGLMHAGRLIALGRPEELKRAHASESLVAVYCDRPARAAAALQAVEGVKHARLHGAGLHVQVAHSKGAAERLTQALRGAGIRVERAEPVEASLEDVFVSLTREADARLAAEAA